jgi:signal transduction histidine kinase
MTIRARFSLWYLGSVLACTAIIVGHAYHEIWLRDHGVPSEERSWEVVTFTMGMALPLALVGLGGGWWLTRRSLDQLHAIIDAAAHTKAENLAEIIPRSRNGDEFDRLTSVFNEMRQRLNLSFQQIREFTLAASHELKTPLTLMRAGLETTIQQLPVSAAPQRPKIEDVVDEIDRLAYIVDRLTFLSKADAGLIRTDRSRQNLSELVSEACEDASMLGSSLQLKISHEIDPELYVLGDAARLRQMLLNLVDNAVKYNQTQGHIHLQLRRVDQQAHLTIRNSGVGLSSELQQRVFDRFFRGDSSHNQTIEGSGLGLNIVRWIIESHGGTVSFHSIPQQWTTLKVKLPLAQEIS